MEKLPSPLSSGDQTRIGHHQPPVPVDKSNYACYETAVKEILSKRGIHDGNEICPIIIDRLDKLDGAFDDFISSPENDQKQKQLEAVIYHTLANAGTYNQGETKDKIKKQINNLQQVLLIPY